MCQSYQSAKYVVSVRPRQLASRSRQAAQLAVVWVAVVLCVAPHARAGAIPFPSENVSYQLQGETLKGFLQRFFEDLGIAVILSGPVQEEPGTLNGPRVGGAAAVFRSIVDSNGLVAYYDGSVAFIHKRGELASRYFEIDPERVDAFREATIGFGLTDANDSLQINPTGVVNARGTPRFLEQLAQLSSALSHRARSPSPQAHTTLRFFALKYAWADDTTFTVGNQKTVVPGIASILRQLLGQDGGRFPQPPSTTSPAVNGLRGRGLAALADRLSGSGSTTAQPAGAQYGPTLTSVGQQADRPSGAEGQQMSNPMLDKGDTPRIVADPYRNALIVRDYAERMPAYEELIRKLDVESQIIQLDATVIDIDKTRELQLGVNWSYQNGNSNVALGSNVNPTTSTGGLSGLQVSSIIGNAATFMSRVNALEQNGVTNIVERPQVVTLNDTEAIVESTQSVYVPVSGAFDEDLYGVMAGTTLRVTPHIIVDNGRRRIRLLVTIEDGTVTVNNQSSTTSTGAAVVQAVPTVANNAVNTQAIIDEGQGLLLGGLTSRQSVKTTSKVPILGSIPLVGRLFRSDTTTHEDTQRLFLISPKIIVMSAATDTALHTP
jgi:type III secretion protein C